MFVCYNYADNILHLCIETHESKRVNPSKKLFYYGGTFNVFRGPIWCQIFRGNKDWFLAKQTIAFFFFDESAKQTP